jgi:hypothetical protein
MGRLLLELGNSQNWIPLWSYRLEAGQVWGLQKAIPEQVVPVLLDRRILAAKTTSLAGSPTWKYGGLIKPLLQCSNGNFSEALIKPERLSLNDTKLIFLEDLGEYRLKISPPKWFPSFELDLWSYIGLEQDTGEFVRGRVRRFYTYTPSPTPIQILAKRDDRSSATMYNSSTSTVYIGFSPDISPSNAPETLYPGGQWVSDGGDIGEIWMVADGFSNMSLQVVEYAQT